MAIKISKGPQAKRGKNEPQSHEAHKGTRRLPLRGMEKINREDEKAGREMCKAYSMYFFRLPILPVKLFAIKAKLSPFVCFVSLW
jgi:hypothetical protein